MTVQRDGHGALVSFASDSSVQMWAKEITPLGLEGGGPIDVTTMNNTAWRTQYPKTLKQAKALSMVVAYDPAVYDEIITMLNSNQAITLTFNDNSTVVFYGWINDFQPGRISSGEQPTAELTIEVSNLNGSGVETAPAYSA